jgi:ATP-grasp domain, R2K clade family 2
MVNWIVEDGVFGSSIIPLVSEIQNQGHQVRIIDYSKEDTDFTNFFPEDECILFYGSIHVASKILILPWAPGIIGKINSYYCTNYYQYLSKWLLNTPHYILSLKDLCDKVAHKNPDIQALAKNKRLFVRPDSPLKLFPGNVYSLAELDNLQLFMRRHYIENENILVVVAPERQIDGEWRVIVCDGKIIGASQYKQFGKPFYTEGMPEEVKKLAQEVAGCGWQPDSIWALDLCICEGKVYILEIGFFSCAALYRCELISIVREASRIAVNEWNKKY